jgi:DNA polymerase-3 subunit gamma/tau
MLGLSDQSILLDLFESIINANIQTSLEIIEKFNKNGADPSLILKDLLNICYWIMRIKVINSSIEKLPFANSEKSRFEDLSKKLTIPTLSRIWQLLFKGLNETNTAPNPEQTLEVIIIRTAHSSSIPLPHELIKQINQNNSEDPENKKKIKTEESTLPASSFQQTSPASSLKPQNIIELFEILRENKEILLIKEIEDNLIIHEFQYGQISLSQKDAKRKTDQKLKKILNNITKINWKLDIILFDKTHQTINDKKEEETKNLEKDLKNNPLIKILFETFDNLTIDKIESINNNKTN